MAETTTAEIRVELPTFILEGGARAPMTVEAVTIEEKGTSIDGLQLSLSHAASYNALRFPVGIPGDTYNTLAFEARFEGDPLNFSVLLTDGNGIVSQTGFTKHATQLDNGWHAFTWDIINQPDIDKGIDPGELALLSFKFPFPEVPQGTIKKMEVRDIRFLSDHQASAGDPALFSQWQAYAKAYRPDYSDSSAALNPPEKGRIPAPLSLVSQGRAVGEIVLPPDAPAPEQTAAKELQRWLKEITTAELPIVSQPSAPEVAGITSIHLGRKLAEATYPGDIVKLGETDGFAVRTDGRNIHIFGAIPKGTINGVFAFLENNTDIIWARPHADYGTVYTRQPDFSVAWGDALDIPAGKLRSWLPNAGGTEGWFSLWAAHNRCNHNMRTAEWGEWNELGGGHNLQTFIPKNDPIYYPVIGGKKPETLSIWKHQICLSVPDLAETYARNVLKWIQEKQPGGVDIFNIKIEDNWGVCECEQCTTPLTLPNGETLPPTDPAFRSTQFYRFLNEVTEKLVQARPNLKVQTYAYFFTATPPKVSLHPNLYVLFCPYVRKDHRTPLYAPINDHWWQMQKAWGEKTPNVVVREYYGIFNQGRPLAEVVATDVKARLAQGVSSFSSETMDDDQRLWWDGAIRGGGDEYDLDMMDRWIITRLYWNADADVEALRKYFIRRTFREAAPEIERVFGMIREHWYTQRGFSTWGEGVLHRAFIASGGREAEVRELLDTALRKAIHPTARILTARLKERIETTCLPAKPVSFESARKINGENYFSAAGILTYGWGLPAYRTTVEQKGAFRTAIRVRFTRDVAVAATRPFLTDLSHRTIRFRIARTAASANVDPANLPKLWITQNNQRQEAADYQPNADGSFTCEWTPNGNAVNLSAVNRFQLMYPESRLGEGDFDEFVLTDITVTESKTEPPPSTP